MGNGRSEKWQMYLYSDQTINVKRDSAEVLTRVVPPLGIVWALVHLPTLQLITPSTSCVCHPSVAWE